MDRNFFTNEKGDTNIISIIVVLAVIIALALLFKSYIADLISLIFK